MGYDAATTAPRWRSGRIVPGDDQIWSAGGFDEPSHYHAAESVADADKTASVGYDPASNRVTLQHEVEIESVPAELRLR